MPWCSIKVQGQLLPSPLNSTKFLTKSYPMGIKKYRQESHTGYIDCFCI